MSSLLSPLWFFFSDEKQGTPAVVGGGAAAVKALFFLLFFALSYPFHFLNPIFTHKFPNNN